MRQLNRYIGRSVAAAIFLVLLVLVSLFLFFTFIEEARDIGQGNYQIWDALQYVLLLSPRRIYELFPIAVLLGSLIGLGTLANNSELTVMRAAGVSTQRIIWSVMKISLLFMIPIMIMGETLASYSEQYARYARSVAKAEQISLKTKHGFWARDGKSFVHIKKIDPGGELHGVSTYGFDAQQQLRQLGNATTVAYRQDHWLVSDLHETRFHPNNPPISHDLAKLSTHQINHTIWHSLLNPRILNLLTLKAERLSGLELVRYVRYLTANDLDARAYQLALWQKITYPLVTAIMVFLAAPFVFGSLRRVSVGQRVLVGAFLGILFHIINQAAGHSGLIYGLPPALSALLPILVFSGLVIVLMRRLA